MKRILIIILCCLYLPCHALCEEMPIIAYYGVPDNYTSEENYRMFSECGFTINIYPYFNSLNLLVKACRIANKYGVKVIGKCPEITNNPSKAANTLRKEDGFFGYFIKDEPNVPGIRNSQKEIENLQHLDSIHLFYINLLPYDRPEWLKSSTKAKTYPEYLKALSETSCQQISFDFYPITTAGIKPTWYNNLNMIRQESLRTGKPFWGFVLSVPHDVPFTPNTYYPTPTLASLRLQVYSNLAYGAQAIQYFTYWTPDGSNSFHFHDAPIGIDGKKTKTYDVVQKMNRELKVIARLFYGAKVLSVHHLGGELPEGTTKQTKMPLNLSSLKVGSSKGAIITQLDKEGHRYLAIVNKDHKHSIKIHIKPLNSTPRHLTKTLKEEEMKDTYTVSAGDILLFRLE